MTMNFFGMQSLERITLVKIAITLVNKNDIQKLISKCPKINSSETDNVQTSIELVKKELKKVENEILKYVLRLSLPNLLKKKLLSFIEAIGWQLIKWRECHPFEDSYKINFTKFQWTPQGTIDRKKTAELYLNDESIPVHLRYIVACEACLKDYVCTLWKKLKEWPGHKGTGNLEEIHSRQSIQTSYWSHYMKGKLHLLNQEVSDYCSSFGISPCFSLNGYLFHRSLWAGNVIATRYFYQKLTPQENVRLLRFTEISLENHNVTGFATYPIGYLFDMEGFADTAAFLISCLNEEQQKEIFRKCPYYVLQCFLIWPRQTFFMEIAKSIFCCPTQISSSGDKLEVVYYKVLKKIASKIASDSIDYNYRKLLAEFWHGSHHTYKKYVTKNYASDSLLSSVFKVEDTENIRIVLKDSIISRKRKSFCD